MTQPPSLKCLAETYLALLDGYPRIDYVRADACEWTPGNGCRCRQTGRSWESCRRIPGAAQSLASGGLRLPTSGRYPCLLPPDGEAAWARSRWGLALDPQLLDPSFAGMTCPRRACGGAEAPLRSSSPKKGARGLERHSPEHAQLLCCQVQELALLDASIRMMTGQIH